MAACAAARCAFAGVEPPATASYRQLLQLVCTAMLSILSTWPQSEMLKTRLLHHSAHKLSLLHCRTAHCLRSNPGHGARISCAGGFHPLSACLYHRLCILIK